MAAIGGTGDAREAVGGVVLARRAAARHHATRQAAARRRKPEMQRLRERGRRDREHLTAARMACLCVLNQN